MRRLLLHAAILLLLGSAALGQSFDMTVHLGSGGTVTIPTDDIQRIVFVDLLSGIEGPEDSGQPSFIFQLMQNSPNPFGPSTTIQYEIPDMADVTVRIYDVRGALIRELLHQTQPAGRYHMMWDGTDGSGARVLSGVYFSAVECGGQTLSQKLILFK